MLLVRTVPEYWQEVIYVSAFDLLRAGSTGNIFSKILSSAILRLTAECCFLYFFISDAFELNACFILVELAI